MAGVPGRRPAEFIVEKLDDETLVYDTERNEAHRLDAAATAEFNAAPDDVSRREVIRRLALVGAAAAGAAPLVKTVLAPAPAQAQSCVDPSPSCSFPTVPCCPGFVCDGAGNCQSNTVCQKFSGQTCVIGAFCCGPGGTGSLTFCGLSGVCP